MAEDSPRRRGRGTFRELTTGKPGRGRPRHANPRQSVYVALSKEQKQVISALGKATPGAVKRADIPDMVIMMLSARFEKLRAAVADRQRELPEGITDLESLFFLWDLDLPPREVEKKWTSVRLTTAQAVEFGRLQGTFNALFGSNRSEVFELGLALLETYIERGAFTWQTVDEFVKAIA